jgi:hypothetical protein
MNAKRGKSAKFPGMDQDARKEALKLRRDILKHISALGLPAQGGSEGTWIEPSKQAIRLSHARQRRAVFEREYGVFGSRWPKLCLSIANGSDVDPRRISPELVHVESGSETGDLFRLACLLWSVPVSRGYGRRMRYLIRDRQNGMLIGLFALNDPVFNLRARDEWIGWDVNDRRARLVNVMDAYVVGAVPPYSYLLGGKLVASLMGSEEVCRDFRAKYRKSKGIISRRNKDPHLVLITVTSALGRSSIYNRLRLKPDTDEGGGRAIVQMVKLGETKGYGHFQLSEELFSRIRDLLDRQGHSYANGHQYGQGPNWRMRVIRAGLEFLRLDKDLLRHGLRREVYGMPLIDEFREYLMGHRPDVPFDRPSLQQISDAALERWIIPRSHRNGAYVQFRREQFWDHVIPA